MQRKAVKCSRCDRIAVKSTMGRKDDCASMQTMQCSKFFYRENITGFNGNAIQSIIIYWCHIWHLLSLSCSLLIFSSQSYIVHLHSDSTCQSPLLLFDCLVLFGSGQYDQNPQTISNPVSLSHKSWSTGSISTAIYMIASIIQLLHADLMFKCNMPVIELASTLDSVWTWINLIQSLHLLYNRHSRWQCIISSQCNWSCWKAFSNEALLLLNFLNWIWGSFIELEKEGFYTFWK